MTSLKDQNFRPFSGQAVQISDSYQRLPARHHKASYMLPTMVTDYSLKLNPELTSELDSLLVQGTLTYIVG